MTCRLQLGNTTMKFPSNSGFARTCRCAAVGIIAVAACAPLQAADNASDYALQEVVVTAQKRTENAQNVPISMSVFGAAQLQDSGSSASQISRVSYRIYISTPRIHCARPTSRSAEFCPIPIM